MKFVVFDKEECVLEIPLTFEQVGVLEMNFDFDDPVVFGPPYGCEFYGTKEAGYQFMVKCLLREFDQ